MYYVFYLRYFIFKIFILIIIFIKFRSFVPPVRDDESETQRKAHAKRVRETRRSTQGVTLEELKSAEQIVKQKNQDTGKSKLNSSVPVETNNNSTINIGTAPQVSIVILLKYINYPLFTLWDL